MTPLFSPRVLWYNTPVPVGGGVQQESHTMSDNPTCPQFPARPPHGGGEPFIAPPAPCRKPGLSVLSVNGRTPDGHGDLALTYIDGAEYAAGYGDPPRPALLFRQGDEVVAVVDATPLLKDGMVSSVEVSGGKLVVTFNTDAGKEPVEIPLTDIFDPASYYDKAAADGRFALKGEMSVAAGTGADADKTTITLMPGVLATVLSAHQPLDAYFNAAEYDSAGRKILLKHGSVVKAQIDATAFIKDGMVSSVAISSGKLVITFNTDAGLEPIEIPLTDIFNPANYYDKTATDTLLSGKADRVANATSGNLATLDENGNLIDSGNRVAGAFAADSFIGGGSGMVGFELDSTDKWVELYIDLHGGVILKFPLHGDTLAVQEDIAPTFDETDTYDEGALVFHNGLYRCTNQSGHTGEWLEADFSRVTVKDVLADKADKVAYAVKGNLATLDSNGDLADSGMAIGDFAVAKSLAPAFVPYNAYEVGDLCTSFDNDPNHKGTWLYKCILATDGSQLTMPEIDPTHWALATVEDVLTALRTAVAGKQDALSAAQLANIAAVPNKVRSFASVGGASATVENGVAKLSDFFTESNSLLTATIDAEVISKGTAPDAHIEAPTDEHLRLILADNSVAYDSAKALPYKLTSVIGDRVVATMTLTAASTDITLPTIAANDTTVKDFILDVTNAYAVEGVATDAGINIPRTDFKLVTRDGESLTAVTTVKAGKSAFICFTQKSPVVVDGTTYPCWCVIQLPFGDPS